MHWYSAPRFNIGVSSALEGGPHPTCWEGEALPGRKVVGMAGVIPGPVGLLAVLAVEREAPFSLTDQVRFTEWVELAAIPAGAAVASARAERLRHNRKLRLADLPLERLEEIPNLAEVERLVIGEAMRRARSNKTKAAGFLGLTREGLRKKIGRLADA